jgi:BlaI family transcriptional regulator, penicillinase repressor
MEAMKELTKAEEQIMQILWKIRKGFVKDIIEKLPEPKPAYNTVSTIVRILEKKNFVSYKAYGKTHEYFPLIKKDEYKQQSLKRLVKNYFSNSFGEMVSFFAQDKNLDQSELEEIIKIINEEINKQRTSNHG